MLQLSPQENFTIVRSIDDPGDTTTYYIKAFVRKASDDSLLDTVELTDQGSGRFSATYRTPADTSGQGLFITVETKVYTDAGYTTLSARYARVENTYLVQERINRATFGGGGGVDYKKIKKIVSEEIEGSKVEQKDYDKSLDEISKKINQIEETLDKWPGYPEPKEIDLKPVIKAIEQTTKEVKENRKKIGDIKIPEPKEVDLEPVERAIKNSLSAERKEVEDMRDEMLSTLKELNRVITETKESIRKKLEGASTAVNIDLPKPKEEEKPKRKFIR